MRGELFTFRVNSDEKQLIAALAEHWGRSQSDAIRWLIREAARTLHLQAPRPQRPSASALPGDLAGQIQGKADLMLDILQEASFNGSVSV